MTPNSESSTGVLFVAIDVAKQIHEVLIEPPTGGRQRWRRVNCQAMLGSYRRTGGSNRSRPGQILRSRSVYIRGAGQADQDRCTIFPWRAERTMRGAVLSSRATMREGLNYSMNDPSAM